MEELNSNTETAEKTFTQAELDAIVESRLAREKSKYADYDSLKEKAGKYDEMEERGKTELQKATEKADRLQEQLDKLNKTDSARKAREKVAAEKKVPVELLTGEDEEACEKQAEALLKFARPTEYPGPKPNEKRKNNSATPQDPDWGAFARQIFSKGE